MSKIIFQIAQSNDLNQIATLHANSWQQNNRGILSDDFLDNKVHEERLTAWTQRFQNPAKHQYILTAKAQNQVVGFTCLFGGKHARYGTYLDNLHIAKEWKGKGIGKQLMALAGDWAAKNYPNQGLYLLVFAANTPAIGFYERIGGKKMETAPYDLGDGTGRLGSTHLYYWENPQSLVT